MTPTPLRAATLPLNPASVSLLPARIDIAPRHSIPFAPCFLLPHRVPTPDADPPRYTAGRTTSPSSPTTSSSSPSSANSSPAPSRAASAVSSASPAPPSSSASASRPTPPRLPHTALPPSLKRYYLLQTAYWVQQFLVLVLGLEKPRKDYRELVAHHVVTLFLVVTSYVMNLTYIGSAIYMSMDIPDMFLALSKLLNYIQWNTVNNFVLAAFVLSWGYFRHYLNLTILWSVWFQFEHYIPSPETFPPHVWHTAFAALVLLQALNLFWGYLIVRIVVRVVTTSKAADVRSDDEDEGEDEPLEPERERRKGGERSQSRRGGEDERERRRGNGNGCVVEGEKEPSGKGGEGEKNDNDNTTNAERDRDEGREKGRGEGGS
ncbi:TLC domain-containing protein [Mycena metata]|uniref:TLC domain-containing protein n=1 Tax=Mycena metata TaxID=1033252 RepID=A0AAD7ML45_9AGAR|nr:TLC domain-containing protein [Mycena metata]